MTRKKGVNFLKLDVLKPHIPNIVEFGQILSTVDNVMNVDINVEAVDEKTETVKILLEGKSLHFEEIKKSIEEFGAVVHSVDRVSIGKEIKRFPLSETCKKQ